MGVVPPSASNVFHFELLVQSSYPMQYSSDTASGEPDLAIFTVTLGSFAVKVSPQNSPTGTFGFTIIPFLLAISISHPSFSEYATFVVTSSSRAVPYDYDCFLSEEMQNSHKCQMCHMVLALQMTTLLKIPTCTYHFPPFLQYITSHEILYTYLCIPYAYPITPQATRLWEAQP